MNAAEHYREGERILALVYDSSPSREIQAVLITWADAHFAAAQVGATLAASIAAAWFNTSNGAEMDLYRAAVDGHTGDDS